MMNQGVIRRKVLQLSALLIAFGSLIGFSILPSTVLEYLYLPIINRLWPGEPGTRSPLLITEILYNPEGQEPGGEWIEIFNRGYDQLNLGQYKIGDSEEQGDMEGMFKFPSGAIIFPGQVIIIANNATQFSEMFGFLPDFEFSESGESVPDMVKDKSWASGSVNLSNSGDEILLVDQDNALLDVISWGKSTFAFSPPIAGVEEGKSIERKPADNDRNQASDWIEQSNPQPGKVDLVSPTAIPTLTPTPTSTPTPTPYIPVLVINEIHADPDPDQGDANMDGNVNAADDEFIEILNKSEGPINISEWILADFYQTRHVFPIGTILQPGCGVVVFGGGDPDNNFGKNLVQFASSGGLSLDNFGDLVAIIEPTTSEEISYSYGPEAGDNQSITRFPDKFGEEPLIKHSLAAGSGGALFSPGTKIDGSQFSGCSE